MSDAAPFANTVVFCDLDGTLVLDNSFHIFLAVAWSYASAKPRVALALLLGKRALGGWSGGHAGLKRRALDWFAKQPDTWKDAVVANTITRLQTTVSTPIRAVMQTYADGGAVIVLATAAPEVYAAAFAEKMHAADCLATGFAVDPQGRELLGARKAEACQTWLARHGGAPRVVVLTDHPDDLPLLRLADKAVIQASPAAFADICARLYPTRPVLQHIDPLGAQPGGGYWLWFDDRPNGPLDAWEVRTVLSKHRYAQIYCGAGQWRPIGPGQLLDPAVLRRDCPRPPRARRRLMIHLHRRIKRDWLGVFH